MIALSSQNNTIDTRRLSTAGGQDTYPATLIVEDEPCYIEKAEPAIALMFEEKNAFEVYKCITFSRVDIEISDLVVDKDSNEYFVRGVEHFENNTDIENHTEIIMAKKF